MEKKINDADKIIADTSKIVKKKRLYNTKITEMENKIPSTSGLVTNSALTAVKNKMLMLVI